MDAFAPTFFSLLFNASIALFVSTLLLILARRLRLNKFVTALLELPDEQKGQIVVAYKKQISMLKVLLWMVSLSLLFPIVLLVYLLIFRAYLEAAFQSKIQQILLTSTAMLIVGHVYLWEDFFYKKKVLKSIENSIESEVS